MAVHIIKAAPNHNKFVSRITVNGGIIAEERRRGGEEERRRGGEEERRRGGEEEERRRGVYRRRKR